MQRVTQSILVLILTLALVACGGTDSDDEPEANTDETTATSTTVVEDEDEEETAETEPTIAEEETAESEPTVAEEETAESEPPAAEGEEKVLVWAGGVEITTLDGAFVTDLVTNSLIDVIYQKLVQLQTDYTVAPQLAESWETSEDGLIWTFSLQEGFMFSNGNPVTAEAVKFSLDRVRAEETGSPNRSVFSGISEITVIDDYTVEIVTAEPFPDLLQALADRSAVIMDPETVQQYDDPLDVGRNPVGSGPYQLAEWEAGIGVVLERNPNYGGTPPAIDKIEYQYVPEAGTRMARVQTGEADVISGPVLEDVDELEADPDTEILVAEGIVLITFELLVDKPPLDNVLVRQAMNHAIDKEAIAQDLLLGYATVRCSPVTPAVGPEFYFEQDCYEYDPEKAKDLLAEAGYPDGFEMEMWCPVGRYLKDREICETVQFYLSAVGIDAKLETFEWATYRTLWADPDRTMWMIGRGAGFTDFIFTRLFAKDQWDSGANNNTRFHDPRVEELLELARSTFDVEQRAEYYREIQEIVWDFAPYIILHTQDNILAHGSNVTGLEVIPNSVLVLEGVDKE